MGSDETQKSATRSARIRLPIPFEEAVGDILKVKPSPAKKRRGKRRKVKEKPND